MFLQFSSRLLAVLSASLFAAGSLHAQEDDSDGDLLPDAWEFLYFGDLSAEPEGDEDLDNLTNAQELAAGTDPLAADTDGDTISDSVEWNAGSDPADSTSLPTSFIGQAARAVDRSLGAGNSAQVAFPGLDALDVTFRLSVDFEAKEEGDRELLFETGAGGVGISLLYEAGSQLVFRASGTPQLAEIFYPLTAAQLAAGDVEVVFTYDVVDEADVSGRSTIALFVDGALVGSDTDALGGDWSGSNGAGFGIVGSGVAGIEGGGNLTAINFASGVINLRTGLQFYSDVLYVPAAGELKITSVDYDGTNLTIVFDSADGVSYSVEESSDLQIWSEAVDPIGTGSSTTVALPYDASVMPLVFLRVRELSN